MTIRNYECSVDLLRVLLWQDNESVNLQQLLTLKQNWYNTNHCEFWNNWVVDVFDLRTANEFGLRVWSEILNVPLFGTTEASPSDYLAFGFDAFGTGFGQGNFATDSNSNFGLTLEQQRIVLRLKAFKIQSRANYRDTNAFLSHLLGHGVMYVLDGQDMSIQVVYTQTIGGELLRAVQDLDLIPRPSGVSIRFVFAGLQSWGFDPLGLNFNNGNFVGG